MLDPKKQETAAPEGYSMQVAARRSGVSPHLIRMWERRYGAVKPQRTATGRRVYTEDAIERLRLLYAATQAGHNIGSIALLPVERLRAILSTDAQAATRMTLRFTEGGAPAEQWVARALHATQEMQSDELRAALEGALLALGRVATIEQVIAPLMEDLGERWRSGEMRVAHEHLAASAARTFLGAFLEGSVSAEAPLLVATTLEGQTHEIGALMAGATASSEGWRVLYPGPNLPAEEIGAVVRAHEKNGLRALALSFVYPPDDSRLEDEVRRLGEFLPPGLPIFAGGRAVQSYAAALDAIGARRMADLQELRHALEELRR